MAGISLQTAQMNTIPSGISRYNGPIERGANGGAGMTLIPCEAIALLAKARIMLQRCLRNVPWEACGDRMLRLL